MKLTARERLIYDAIQGSPSKTATLDSLTSLVSASEGKKVHRNSVNVTVKGLMLKMLDGPERLRRITGIGRGVKAKYQICDPELCK